jgi:hypothetical protein
VHVQGDVERGHAQAWRARAGQSVPVDATDALTLTQRSQELIAARWGKPIEEPPPDVPAEDGEGPHPIRLRDGLKYLSLWREPLPSQRAVTADNAEGWEQAKQAGLLTAAVYVVFWLPARAVNAGTAFLHAMSGRPGRFAGFLFVVGLFWFAYKIATS